MALAINSQETSNAGHRTTISPLTWTFTNTAGTLLIVCAVVSSASGAVSLGAVTYGGVAMTAGPSNTWDGGHSVVGIFSLTSPATGANTVSVAGTAGTPILAGAISFTGANPTTPLGANATGSNGTGVTHATTTAITAAAGNYVLGVGGWGSGTAASPDSGQSTAFALTGSGASGGDDIFAGYQQSTGAAITPGFTWTPADVYGMVATEIQAAGAGAAAAVIAPTRSPLGL